MFKYSFDSVLYSYFFSKVMREELSKESLTARDLAPRVVSLAVAAPEVRQEAEPCSR